MAIKAADIGASAGVEKRAEANDMIAGVDAEIPCDDGKAHVDVQWHRWRSTISGVC